MEPESDLERIGALAVEVSKARRRFIERCHGKDATSTDNLYEAMRRTMIALNEATDAYLQAQEEGTGD